ncbi:MAG: glycosyltransferase family A protein, partial [Acidimicrobiia bacterium]
MTGQKPTASIVIRCYNEAEHIGKLLSELKRQSFSDFEIVVVDSGSDDGTLEILQSEDVALEHIRKENFSFGRSLNIGCRAATGEFLVFISAHCYPEHENWLANLIAGF